MAGRGGRGRKQQGQVGLRSLWNTGAGLPAFRHSYLGAQEGIPGARQGDLRLGDQVEGNHVSCHYRRCGRESRRRPPVEPCAVLGPRGVGALRRA